ncbi:MAG: chalcone isomerase family protein [Vicingaceae bacterium]|nr:chalcone isomerase family protein [Vicingaceae bacterium]
MKKLLFILTIILISIPNVYSQKTFGDVTIPKKMMVGKTVLQLNGAGVREKMWIDLYVCGLFVKTKTTNAQNIIDSKEHCAIKIQIVSSLITSKKMSDAVEDGFKNSLGKPTKEMRVKIDKFKSFFAESEIEDGDIYDIIYIPSKGVVVFKNGKIQPIIEGYEFKKALFAIWLGDKPADDDLKDDLLGDK